MPLRDNASFQMSLNVANDSLRLKFHRYSGLASLYPDDERAVKNYGRDAKTTWFRKRVSKIFIYRLALLSTTRQTGKMNLT